MWWGSKWFRLIATRWRQIPPKRSHLEGMRVMVMSRGMEWPTTMEYSISTHLSSVQESQIQITKCLIKWHSKEPKHFTSFKDARPRSPWKTTVKVWTWFRAISCRQGSQRVARTLRSKEDWSASTNQSSRKRKINWARLRVCTTSRIDQ